MTAEGGPLLHALAPVPPAPLNAHRPASHGRGNTAGACLPACHGRMPRALHCTARLTLEEGGQRVDELACSVGLHCARLACSGGPLFCDAWHMYIYMYDCVLAHMSATHKQHPRSLGWHRPASAGGSALCRVVLCVRVLCFGVPPCVRSLFCTIVVLSCRRLAPACKGPVLTSVWYSCA